MYKSNSKITSGIEELSNYLEEYDIYNSKLLSLINDPGNYKEPYEIKVFKFRPDLIAEDFYGSTRYSAMVMLQSGLGLSELVPGNTLWLMPKETLDGLLRKL